MKQYRKKTNKSIAFYFTLDEVARIDQYCEKYLSFIIIFLIIKVKADLISLCVSSVYKISIIFNLIEDTLLSIYT